MKKNKLYIYTTVDAKKKRSLKIGQTTEEDPCKYIDKQKTHRGSKAIEKDVIGDLPEGVSDKDIHERLKKNGIKEDNKADGSEWYICEKKDVEDAYRQVTQSYILYKYELREEQKEAQDKAVKYFKQSRENKPRFLLNAKMRFGKCFTGISIAKELEAKRTIIVTFKTNVRDSWLKYPKQHKYFTDWERITSIKTRGYPSLEEDFSISKCEKNLALFVSMQDLRDSNKVKFQELFNTKWDLLIFDEVHYGGDAGIEREVFDLEDEREKVEKDLNDLKLKFKYRLDLSGTPFRFQERHVLSEDQIYTYTYIDEQKKKKDEKKKNLPEKERVYEKLPNLNIITTDISQNEIDENKEHTMFHLNKAFKARRDGESYKFNNEKVVNNFLNKLIENGDNAKMAVYSEFKNKCNFMGEKIHAIWWINSVNTAFAFEKKLNNHSFFKDYEVINITGENNKIEERVINNKLEEVDRNTNKEGSIIITHSRLLTGSTLNRLNAILVLNDCENPETYLQAIFRPQSPLEENDKIKEDAYVFDFSIKRVLNTVMRELRRNLKMSPHKNSDTEITQNMIDSFNICKSEFGSGELTFEPVKVEDIIEHYDTASLAKKINTRKNLLNSQWIINLNNNPELMNIIEKIKTYREINEEKNLVLLNSEIILPKPESSIDKATSNQPSSEIDQKKAKERKKKRDKIAKKGVGLSVILADFMYMTKKREENVNHILDNKLQEKEFFKKVTNITTEEFEKLCHPETGLINKEELSSRVDSFNRKESSSLKAEEFILEFLKNQQAS